MSKSILQTYYVYDPNVGDELGNLRVNSNENGKFVLATPQMIQYWIDQGLMGTEPISKLSETSRAFLDQVTRGRSKNNDETPKRVPKYSRATQSGAPNFAGMPASVRNRKRVARDKAGKEKQEPYTDTSSTNPQPVTPPRGVDERPDRAPPPTTPQR
jgi:hypothetical protein